jgi:tetratricopeptide (TPR) repeat protein
MAIPIISGVLGAFGVEAAKEAAGAADEVLGALFGKRASEVLEEVGARLRGYTGEIPPNHDLERTLRLIQLSTNLYLLRDYQGWDEAERFDTRAATPPPFIAAAHAWLRDQIGLCPRTTVVENAPLVAEMERALDALLRSGNPTEAALSRIAAVEAAAWDELAAGAGTPPPDIRARFFGQVEGTPAWRDIFRALLREALKDKPRVKIAFDISRLAALREDTTAIGHAVASLAGDTAALRTTMEAIQAELRELRLLVDRLTHDLSLSESEKRALVSDLARVRAEQQGTLALVTGFLETMVGRHVPPEQFPTTLFAIARDWRQAGERIDALSTSRNLSPRAEALREKARAAHAAGRLDDARQALAAMAAEEQAALTRLEAHAAEIEAERRTRRTSLAQTKAAQAGVEKAALRYRAAAGLYQEASDLVAFDLSEAWRWLLAAADALNDQGLEAGDNAALTDGIRCYRRALALAPRNRVPLDWAKTQNNLGNALRTLGARETGTERLEEAVAAFRLALEERCRDRVPLDWAKTQNNLGNALRTLGERESGPERMEEAVAAYRLALMELRRDRAPLDWAMTQSNLGTALQTLGEREIGTERLEEAVAAYRLALEEYPRNCVPLDWAMTQNNLGGALATLGEREGSMGRLEEAVAAYSLALGEYRRDRVPLDWAMTQNNLGNALRNLGERESGAERLEEAVATFRLALQEYRRERVPLDWAMTQNNLGDALRNLGERESGTERLEEAVATFRLALEEHRRDIVPFRWALTTLNIAITLKILGTRKAPRDHWQSARDLVTAALEEFVLSGAEYYILETENFRDDVITRLASLP